MKKTFTIVQLFCLLTFWGLLESEAQVILKGQVSSADSKLGLEGATVYIKEAQVSLLTDKKGRFQNDQLSPGNYHLTVFLLNHQTQEKEITLKKGINTFNFQLSLLNASLDEVQIEANEQKTFGISRLKSVDGYGIYEAKKNEVIIMDDIAANKATNNARQIFAKVPGLNIWESDCAGLQLDIAARGLGPSRTANFNTRQNGYDISADALGYPESYYTPPAQAIERIEIVRGAASLQYGTQFGGMLNFVLKDAPEEKKFEFTTEQSLGSFNFFNSFNSIGGTLGKFSYYTYYQYKRGDCWRENSAFDLHHTFTKLGYEVNDRLKLNFEYTFLNYQSQQAGGLGDVAFERDPRASFRDRNWFQVNWNLMALTLDYDFSERTSLNVRNFALFSGRESLGNLERIDRIDLGGNRTLIQDDYLNFGNETRLLHRYQIFQKPAALLAGLRVYRGFTEQRQGDANDQTGPDFYYLNPDNLEGSDFDFPSWNMALFAENIINLNDRLSITPGVRIEHIRTRSEGFFKQRVFDFAGNLVTEESIPEESEVRRTFPLFGLGISYKFQDDLELYGNISQNYRSITFSNLRIDNPNFVLDSNIVDEKGYNVDLGFRGNYKDILYFDWSLFYLRYNQRIGFLLLANRPPLFLDFRFQTNIGDSRHYGLESLTEVSLSRLFMRRKTKAELRWYTNFSWIDARYVQVNDRSIDGNKVEYVPEFLLRTGLNFSWKGLKASYQFSYLGEQFTDATNAEGPVAGAVSGLIPSYFVMDLSFSYEYKFLKLSSGINNLTDEIYFTRRAESYPGPGIIPAAGRNFYLTLRGQF